MITFSTAFFAIAVTSSHLVNVISALEFGPGGELYLGCFIDTKDRDLPDLLGTISESYTVEDCFNNAKASGYKYVSLQWAKECFAGNEYGKYGIASGDTCNFKCADGSENECGGNWRNSVYAMEPCNFNNEKYMPNDMPEQGRTVETAAGCQERCERTKGCKYFNFWGDGGCHITTGEGGTVTVSSIQVSGNTTCNLGAYGPGVAPPPGGDCASDGTQYLPIDMAGQGRTETNTAAGCQERCEETPGCNYFNYWNDGGCHITTGAGGIKPSSTIGMSGSTSCNLGAATCTGPTARWWGDPHMITFDNLKYDCMGAGELIAVKDMHSSFEVRGRFQHLYDPNEQKMMDSGVTVTRAVAYNSGEAAYIVSFVTRDETGDDGCTVERYHDGVWYETYEPNKDVNELFENGASIVIKTENVHKYGCYMSVLICVPEGMEVVGLLGNPTGDKADDWMKPDGTLVGVPDHINWSNSYEYCVDNWCVQDDDESMFQDVYENVEGANSFDYYNFCGEPGNGEEMQKLFDEAPPEIKEKCGGDPDCVLENVVGGEEAGDAQEEVNDAFDEYEESYHAGGSKTQSPTTSSTIPATKATTKSSTTSSTVPATKATTKSSTTSSTVPATKATTRSAVYGDPHFVTWAGQKYDYHGICDLVMISHPGFKEGLGMSIHVRSKKTRQWSYISTAVVSIGGETFEVSGKKDGNTHFLNMIEVENEKFDENSVSIENFPISYTQSHESQREYIIDLGNNESINLKTWKDMVRVDIIVNRETNTFGGSLGLMGSFPEGIMLGRDGTTIISKFDHFGEEWQVLSYEPKFFHRMEGPQHPRRCEIPSKGAMRRDLAQSVVGREQAEIACAKVDINEFDLCVFDVMATGDANSAGAY